MNTLDRTAFALALSEGRAASYHEAGHAFAFEHFGQRVDFVTVVGDNPRPFVCVPEKRFRRPAHSLKQLQVSGIISFAGEEAERLYRSRLRRAEKCFLLPLAEGALSDRLTVEHSVRNYVQSMTMDPTERWLIIRRTRKAARALVRANWPVIRKIAEELDANCELVGRQVRRIMRTYART